MDFIYNIWIWWYLQDTVTMADFQLGLIFTCWNFKQFQISIYVCFNYGNHCALTFAQRRHSIFPGSKNNVRTACLYLASFLINIYFSHRIGVLCPCSLTNLLIVQLFCHCDWLKDDLQKAIAVFLFWGGLILLFILVVLSESIENTSGRYSNFIYSVPNLN